MTRYTYDGFEISSPPPQMFMLIVPRTKRKYSVRSLENIGINIIICLHMSGTKNRARLLPLPWRGVKTFSISPILLLPLFSFLCRTWLKVGSVAGGEDGRIFFSRISSWTRAARMQRADDSRHSRGGRLEFLLFFSEFESLLCEAFNVKHSTNFTSTNTTHQRSHCSTRQFKKCKVTTARKKEDFFIDDRRGWGKMAYASQGHFPKCFLFTFFPLSFSLSPCPARHPIKGTVAPATFLFLPPPPFSQERAAWWRSGIVTHRIRLDWAEKDPVR